MNADEISDGGHFAPQMSSRATFSLRSYLCGTDPALLIRSSTHRPGHPHKHRYMIIRTQSAVIGYYVLLTNRVPYNSTWQSRIPASNMYLLVSGGV